MALGGQLGVDSLGSFVLGAVGDDDPTSQVVSNSFGWSAGQTLTRNLTFNVLAANVMGWNAGQEATSNFVYYAASNSFGWEAGSISGYNQYRTVVQYFGWTPRQFKSASNAFGWTVGQHAGEATNVDASNFLWTDGPTATRAYKADNNFGWTETVNPKHAETVENEFGWVDTVDFANSTLGSDLDQSFLKQTLTYRISGAGTKCREKEYTPQLGEGGQTTKNLTLTAPTLVKDTLTLTYPYVSPTTTLTLKNPDFGNSDSLQLYRIDRHTHGRSRKIVSDDRWKTNETLELTMTNVCHVTTDAIVSFLNDSLGGEIGLLDWFGRQWRGIIVTPETDVITNSGGWSITITFEGSVAVVPVQFGELQVVHDTESIVHG